MSKYTRIPGTRKAIKIELCKHIECDGEFVILQKRPYTIAVGKCMIGDECYTGVGVAKVSGKDWWTPSLGKRIAKGRAISNIIRQRIGDGAAWKMDLEGMNGVAAEIEPVLDTAVLC